MNSTKYFGLCQWDPEDRILREDFNANNEITDTILAALDDELQEKLGRPELIRQWVSSGNPNCGTSRAFRLDWNEWEYVCIFFDYPKTDQPTTSKIRYTLGDKEGTPQGPTLSILPFGPACIVFFPHHDETRPTQGLLFGSGIVPFKFDDIPFSRIDGYDIFPGASDESFPDPNVYGFGGK